jgi:phenylpyruvate tautomerase PptA (4-oxalocrotonate tautomerase family)
MPMYQCQSPAGTLSDSVRPEVIKEITRIHCENTTCRSYSRPELTRDLR